MLKPLYAIQDNLFCITPEGDLRAALIIGIRLAFFGQPGESVVYTVDVESSQFEIDECRLFLNVDLLLTSLMTGLADQLGASNDLLSVLILDKQPLL